MSILQVITKTLLAPLVLALQFSGYSVTAPITPPPSIIDDSLSRIVDLQKKIKDLQSQVSQQQSLGTSPFVPNAVANFRTSLASQMLTTDTTMTLVSMTTDDGTDLIIGRRYGFTIDEALSTREDVVGTIAASNQVTNLIRGLSVNTGTTTIAALKQRHGRGASVKITNAPLDIILRNIVDGRDFFPNPLVYASTTAACTLNDGICDKEYIDGVVVAGASNANETTKGIIELSTAAEMASSTSAGGTAARLVAPNSLFSEIYTGSQLTPVTKTNGKLSSLFIDQGSRYAWTASTTFLGAVNLHNGTTTWNGSHAQVGIGTSTPAISSGLSVNQNLYVAGGVGIGDATTTSGANLYVAGNSIFASQASTTDLVISRTCTGCPLSYTGSSTPYTLSSGSRTDENAIPSNANFATGVFSAVNVGGGNLYGTFTFARTGMTGAPNNVNVGFVDAYTFFWSGNNLLISEDSDAGSDSTISGTIYWYK